MLNAQGSIPSTAKEKKNVHTGVCILKNITLEEDMASGSRMHEGI
jgi:hypothetical protein